MLTAQRSFYCTLSRRRRVIQQVQVCPFTQIPCNIIFQTTHAGSAPLKYQLAARFGEILLLHMQSNKETKACIIDQAQYCLNTDSECHRLHSLKHSECIGVKRSLRGYLSAAAHHRLISHTDFFEIRKQQHTRNQASLLARVCSAKLPKHCN